MITWLPRGVILAAVCIVARVLLGQGVIDQPLHSTSWKTLAIAAVALVAVLWGGIDGMIDGRAHPDPDDNTDLTVRWLKAGIFAGVVAGVICWILGHYYLKGIGEASLPLEIFAGGSFSALLIFIPAFVGAGVGRWLMRRDQRKKELSEDWSARENANDTEQLAQQR